MEYNTGMIQIFLFSETDRTRFFLCWSAGLGILGKGMDWIHAAGPGNRALNQDRAAAPVSTSTVVVCCALPPGFSTAHPFLLAAACRIGGENHQHGAGKEHCGSVSES
jgi:hypothetical protein